MSDAWFVVGGHARLASCVTTESDRLVCSSAGLGGVLAFFLLLYVAILVLFIVAYVKIVTKAGYSGWWVLIGLVPLVGIVMFLVFAFSKWPVQRELEALRAQSNVGGGYGYGSVIRSFNQPASWGGSGGYSGFPSQGQGPSGFSSAVPGIQSTWNESPQEPVAENPLPPFRSGRFGVSGTETSAAAETGAAPSEQGSVSRRLPPPGWYPTPDGRRRYWDGAAWTDHFA